MREYVVGIDGGGTRTRGVLADTQGNVLSSAETGLTNIQISGPEKCASTIQHLIQQLLKKTSIKETDIAHTYLGLAGAGRETDKKKARDALHNIGIQKLTIETDARIALAGAFGGGEGIILICGTGSICYGKAKNSKMIRSGGWGYLLGDEGSGYFIVREALIAALKDLDGRGDSTTLRKAFEKHFSVQQIDEIIPQVYGGSLDRAAISALAPIVFETAKAGDKEAYKIITMTAIEQSKMITAVAKRLPFHDETIKVSLIGSVFKQKAILVPTIIEQLQNNLKNVTIVEPLFEPMFGAVILALESIEKNIDESMLNTLQRS